VLAYTMPLWAIPIGLFLWPEPLDRAQLIGAAIGFAGLVLFMNPGLVDWGNGHILAGNALLLLASILWALGSCLYRRFSWRSPFWVQTFWQLAVSIVPVGAIVLIEAPGGPVHWSPELVAILAYNCIVTTALGYFLWGKVLSMMPAATAGQVLMLTPIGGFVLSTLRSTYFLLPTTSVLSEPIDGDRISTTSPGLRKRSGAEVLSGNNSLESAAVPAAVPPLMTSPG